MSSSRTLVVAPNWVGDSIMALPVFDALASSGQEVTVLAKPHICELLSLSTSVSSTIARSPKDRETIAHLRSGDFDQAVLLPNSFRSAWLVARAGIPQRWGYRGGMRSPLLRPAVDRPSDPGHQIYDYADLLSAMEIQPPDDWTPALALPEETRERGRQLLARAGLATGQGPVIGLFAGAEFGESKRWPREHFEEAARILRKEVPDANLSIIAGPKETWMAVRLHEETGKIHPVIGPDLGLADLAAVLAQHDVLLTNDSGPMHLAAAVGCRCVALFGPTDADRTAPTGPDHKVLTLNRWCAPCFRRKCPLKHQKCLKEIEPEAAARGVRSMLGGRA